MSPSKTPRKVEGKMELSKKPSVFQAKNIKVLDFMVWVSLQQPGAAGGNIEPGQMSSVETRQMSQQQSSVLSQQQTSVLS